MRQAQVNRLTCRLRNMPTVQRQVSKASRRRKDTQQLGSRITLHSSWATPSPRRTLDLHSSLRRILDLHSSHNLAQWGMRHLQDIRMQVINRARSSKAVLHNRALGNKEGTDMHLNSQEVQCRRPESLPMEAILAASRHLSHRSP